jgi:hypothetical protein
VYIVCAGVVKQRGARVARVQTYPGSAVKLAKRHTRHFTNLEIGFIKELAPNETQGVRDMRDQAKVMLQANLFLPLLDASKSVPRMHHNVSDDPDIIGWWLKCKYKDLAVVEREFIHEIPMLKLQSSTSRVRYVRVSSSIPLLFSRMRAKASPFLSPDGAGLRYHVL